MIELLSLLGAAGGGKMFGIVSDWVLEGRHQKQEEKKQEHERYMASMRGRRKYHADLYTKDNDGTYSPLAHVIAYTIGLFAVTYCAAALSCFLDNPTATIYTKDPSENAAVREILFGIIRWDSFNNRVVEMSKIGLGYLMLHPMLFILSMVTTGDKIKTR